MSTKPEFSPVLFVDSEGLPMRFYIRPGPTKAQVYSVVTEGGGAMSRLWEPGVIYLVDPKDTSYAPAKADQVFVSTKYIWDCVAQNQQLDEFNYRIAEKVQTRSSRAREGTVGRMAYTAQEDEAILNFASQRPDIKGNSMWQLMEKLKVTNHSWQSMKDHYLRHLLSRAGKPKPPQLEFTSTSTAQSEDRERVSEEGTSPSKSAQNAPDTSASGDPKAVTSTEGDSPAEKKPGDSAEQEEQSVGTELDLPPGGDNEQCPPSDEETELGPTPPEATEIGPTPAEGTEQDSTATEPSREKTTLTTEDEPMQPSPKRSRLDTDQRDDIQEENRTGSGEAPEGEPRSSAEAPAARRRLGILDRAVREFRNSFLSEDADQQKSNSADESQSDSEVDTVQEAALPEGNGPSAATENGESATARLPTCSSHLFMFDTESQEDRLQQPSQVQSGSAAEKQALLEGEKLVLDLMNNCKKDLVEVTKALLRTNGDAAFARHYLLHGTVPRSPRLSQKSD